MPPEIIDSDTAVIPRGKLCRIALADIAMGPNKRPRRPGSHTWAKAFEALTLDAEALTLDAEALPTIVLPFEVGDISTTLTIEDDCAFFMEAPAVRLTENGDHESIFGERRFWAALDAGATHASVKVYAVDAAAARLMHYRENACREDLPPLADAEELAQLRDEDGLSAAAIATKTGRTERHVRERLLLLDAIEPVRDALSAGGVTLDAALFFARRDPKEQARAWSKVEERAQTQAEGGTVRLDSYVRRLFERRLLVSAPWPLGDVLGQASGPAHAVDALGTLRACVGCPRRSDAQALLLPGCGDGPDVECLDGACWTSKREAWSDILVERARAAKVPVLEGREAKAAVPTSPKDATGYVDLDGESPIKGSKSEPLTWRMLLPAKMLDALPAEARAVADVGEEARELVRVEDAVAVTKKRLDEGRCVSMAVPRDPAARASVYLDGAEEALDAWAAAQKASRPEVRPAAPAAPEPPKPAKPGTKNDRAIAEAKAREQEIGRLVARMRAKTPNIAMLASWLMRIVSSDALCYVAEDIGDGEGSPRDIIEAELQRFTGHADVEGILAALIAAEMLHQGGEKAELVRRAAPEPKVKKRIAKPPEEPAVEPEEPAPPTPEAEIEALAAEQAADADGPEARIEKCRKALRKILERPRSRAGAMAALRTAAPESSPAERAAALDARIADGSVIEEGTTLKWGGAAS